MDLIARSSNREFEIISFSIIHICYLKLRFWQLFNCQHKSFFFFFPHFQYVQRFRDENILILKEFLKGGTIVTIFCKLHWQLIFGWYWCSIFLFFLLIPEYNFIKSAEEISLSKAHSQNTIIAKTRSKLFSSARQVSNYKVATSLMNLKLEYFFMLALIIRLSFIMRLNES